MATSIFFFAQSSVLSGPWLHTGVLACGAGRVASLVLVFFFLWLASLFRFPRVVPFSALCWGGGGFGLLGLLVSFVRWFSFC